MEATRTLCNCRHTDSKGDVVEPSLAVPFEAAGLLRALSGPTSAMNCGRFFRTSREQSYSPTVVSDEAASGNQRQKSFMSFDGCRMNFYIRLPSQGGPQKAGGPIQKSYCHYLLFFGRLAENFIYSIMHPKPYSNHSCRGFGGSNWANREAPGFAAVGNSVLWLRCFYGVPDDEVSLLRRAARCVYDSTTCKGKQSRFTIELCPGLRIQFSSTRLRQPIMPISVLWRCA